MNAHKSRSMSFTREALFKCFVLLLILIFTINIVFMSFAIFNYSISIKNKEDFIIQLIKDLSFKQNNKLVNNLTYEIDDVYVADNRPCGNIIEFVADGEAGYVIVFNKNNKYIPIEINYGTHSPFYGKNGKNFYPSLGYYLINRNGIFIDATTNQIVDIEIDQNTQFNAAGSKIEGETEEVTITVDYQYGYTMEDKEIMINGQSFYANYGTSLTSAKNNCANVAGLIMLNYWNQRTRNQLLKLPLKYLDGGRVYDRTALMCDGHIVATSDKDYRIEYMDTFYKYMKTNTTFGTGGTMPSDMYEGFERFIKERGYTTIRKTNLTWEQIIENIDNGIPLFITSVKKYYYTEEGRDLPPVHQFSGEGMHKFTVDYTLLTGLKNAHSFVAYGCVTYMFYDEMGNFLYPLCFLRVADGHWYKRYFNYTYSDIYAIAAIKVLPRN